MKSFRFGGSALGGSIGLLTALLETPRIKAVIPWWVMVLAAIGTGVLGGFIPEENDMADVVDNLTVGMTNVAMGAIMDNQAEQTSDVLTALSDLQLELARLKAAAAQ